MLFYLYHICQDNSISNGRKFMNKTLLYVSMPYMHIQRHVTEDSIMEIRVNGVELETEIKSWYLERLQE